MGSEAHIARIVAALREAVSGIGLEAPERIDLREIPFEGHAGYGTALPLALAGKAGERYAGMPKPEIAKAIAAELKAQLEARTDVGTVEIAANGFLNFYFPQSSLVSEILHGILARGAEYGSATEPKPGRVMVEFSQPNTHKGFHIGHVRNVTLGDALVRIFRAAGYETVAANYYGDIGTHVIKALWGYKRFFQGQEPLTRRGTWLGEVYQFAEQKYAASVDLKQQAVTWIREHLTMVPQEAMTPSTLPDAIFGSGANWLHAGHQQLELLQLIAAEQFAQQSAANRAAMLADALRMLAPTPFETNSDEWKYELEVLDTFARWEAKDLHLHELWKKTAHWSLEEFHAIYDELGVRFDVEFFESEEEDPGKAYVKELVAMGLATVDKGATIVRIDEQLTARGLQPEGKERYRTLIILRADGSSLYATKDLSLARKKFKDHNIAQSIYVVADEQAFYFEQIFKILELAGFPQATQCFHLSYGLVTLPEGKMSSRKGNVVLYFDFVAEMLEAARKIVDEKQPDLPESQRADIARMVGYGAMKYDMVKVDSAKTIVFKKEEALSLEGRTAPYVQYAHARACRILEKAQTEGLPSVDPTTLSDAQGLQEAEVELAKVLARLPDVVQKAAHDKNPLPVATYVYDVATQFNDFYQKVPVLKAEDRAQLNLRLALVESTRLVLANGLSLLGIEAPAVM